MLYGSRVLLRPVADFDLDRLLEFANDLEVSVAAGDEPPAPKGPEEVRANPMGERDGLGGRKVDFAIVADGECIGHCGLYDLDPANRSCALGISIGDKGYWGKGYGGEAVNVLLDYAFRIRNFRRVWLEVHAANRRAIRCYAACGFTEEGRLREHVWVSGGYVDVVVMGLLRDEWRAREDPA